MAMLPGDVNTARSFAATLKKSLAKEQGPMSMQVRDLAGSLGQALETYEPNKLKELVDGRSSDGN